jgi:hypothetical protein
MIKDFPEILANSKWKNRDLVWKKEEYGLWG